MKKANKKNLGFTLIELLVAMGMMAILFAMMISTVNSNSTKMGVILEAQKVVAFLREQQANSIAIAERGGHRVCSFSLVIAGNNIQSRYGYSSNPDDPRPCTSSLVTNSNSTTLYTLKSGYLINNGTTTFDVPFGSMSGTATYTLTGPSGLDTDIYIQSTGEVMLEE